MNKKIFPILVALMVLAVFTTPVSADKPVGFDSNGNEVAWENTACTDIQSGTLKRSDGALITTGFDEWGYNYQAHMFNGGYCDSYRNASWCQAWKEDELLMKWNDAWMSNADCDGDKLLDRHLGFASYIGSGAWLTNHMKGSYLGADGQTCQWEYFTKIVAAPAGAVLSSGIWYSSDGMEIGPVIWGEFATIEEVYNDPCGGVHGIQYNAQAPTGFGFYAP